MAKPTWLEPLEQTGHFFMGFGARLVYLDYLLWRREAIIQWPPADDKYPILSVMLKDGEPLVAWRNGAVNATLYYPASRVRDSFTDMRWYVIGATCAEVVRWLLVVLAIRRFCG